MKIYPNKDNNNSRWVGENLCRSEERRNKIEIM